MTERSKLKLPAVTLVMMETREHELARLAVEDAVRQVEFEQVLIFTDRPLEFSALTHVCEPKFVTVPDFSDKIGWCRAMWFTVPRHVTTSHMLLLQWDAGIHDVSMWRDEFLYYDLIGAPWWYDNRNVGNTGFGLKSLRLARYIADRAWQFPCDTPAEDDLLCRKYRPTLEDAGFRWAPEKVAYDFSFEGCGFKQQPKPTRHFGFHAMMNWPQVFDRDRLIERLNIAARSDYIRNSYIMKSFCERNPQLVKDILGESNASNVIVS